MLDRVAAVIVISFLIGCEVQEQSGQQSQNQTSTSGDGVAEASGTGANSVDLQDSEHYFFFKGQLKDVRDFSAVMDEVRPGDAKIIDNSTFLLKNNNHYRVYGDGTLKSQYTLEGYLAPNWRYIIYRKDGDLWRAELNLVDGSTHSATQLTELGVFQREFQYTNWYEDKVFFFASGAWLLDTKTGEISQAPLDCFQNPQFSSPSGRYVHLASVVGGDDCSGRIYDFETNSIHKLAPSYAFAGSHWLDDDIFAALILDEQLIPSQIEVMEFPGAKKIREISVPRKAVPERRQEFGCSGLGNYNHSTTAGYKGPSYLFAAHYLCTLPSWERGEEQLFFIDLETGKTVQWDVELSAVLMKHPTRAFVRRIWASRHHMIYTSEGSLLTQGTWVVDARTGEKKRITPYLAEMYWSFRSAGIAIFKANGKLYRCSADGSDLVVLDEIFGQHDHIQLFAPGFESE